jgi:hypothetical protein
MPYYSCETTTCYTSVLGAICIAHATERARSQAELRSEMSSNVLLRA